jgi:Nucleotide modification associated domain 2
MNASIAIDHQLLEWMKLMPIRRSRWVCRRPTSGTNIDVPVQRVSLSTCLRYDDGAAPNPFSGLCTLAICKPRIRRAAHVGDWVVGTGSVASSVGNLSGAVVCAMRVTQKMTLEDYDRFTQSELSDKIPQWKSTDHRRRYGDSIYDFSTPTPSLRRGVHGEENRKTDLSGGWVLLSDHFFYFGDQPIALPEAQQWRLSSHQAPCGTCTTGRQQESEAEQEEESPSCSSNGCSSYPQDLCAGSVNR